ncbi:3'-5' exoribonuclease HELZ2-like [Trichomycterus rosablanca]|uniref:3'-5' exoribonuclease HELZ2-like n=1 Tax=Trichomycterus rosablanca TaxID=2290929 RepID=UPI002F359690
MSRDEDINMLHILQQTLDLCVCCNQCCKGRTEISFDLVTHSHQCSKNILLARDKGGNNQWKQVVSPPKFPKPSTYAVCWFYAEGRGCKMHEDKCTFARSNEEAAVWNFIKKECIDLSQLISLVNNNATTPVQQETLGCHLVLKRFFSRFQGTFVELCKACFHDSPQKISMKVSDTCASGHSWRPVLIFCHKDEQTKVYNEIRPIPKRNVRQWKLCRYVNKGEPCWHGAHRCWFAHSEIEIAVWMSESSGSVNRPALLRASQMLQTQASAANSGAALQEQKQQHYCHVCRCQFSGHEDFMNHCFSAKHRKVIFEDSTSTWRFRDPPPTSKSFRLCRRLTTCEYGDSCVKAHSVEELQEWIDRHRDARKKARAASMQGLLSYQDSLLEEYRQSEKKETIVCKAFYC